MIHPERMPEISRWSPKAHHRGLSANETHPEGMADNMILAPILRVQSQVSTQTGGGAPLTTG